MAIQQAGFKQLVELYLPDDDKGPSWFVIVSSSQRKQNRKLHAFWKSPNNPIRLIPEKWRQGSRKRFGRSPWRHLSRRYVQRILTFTQCTLQQTTMCYFGYLYLLVIKWALPRETIPMCYGICVSENSASRLVVATRIPLTHERTRCDEVWQSAEFAVLSPHRPIS